MITPIEIQGKSFKSGLGYDKKDVDSFIKELARDYETLYKENVELQDKINTLNEGIQYYKTIEKTIQKALILAEQTAEETKEASRQNAKIIEDEAKMKADLIVQDAKRQLNLIHEKTRKLIEQYDLYKAQYKNLAATQIDILNSDSFQIHVANLDAFIKDDEKQLCEEQNKANSEQSNMKLQNFITENETKGDSDRTERSDDLLKIETI